MTTPPLPPAARAAFAAYGLAAAGAVAVARGLLLRRTPPDERLERLGTGPAPCGPGRLLLHAVSAGEMVAASALVEALARLAPERRVLLTTGTRDGRAVAERVRASSPNVDAFACLPWDRPAVVRRWLERLEPAAVVTVEAELWPGLFLGARALGVPVAVAGGRLRPGEARRYALGRAAFRPVVASASWIGARTEADRARFLAIGAEPSRVEVVGDLKVDAPAPRAAFPPGWDDVLASGPPLLVAGSTHAPEEEVLLDAFLRLRAERRDVRLALAPRHVSRAVEMEGLARAAGLETRRLSGPPGGFAVLVVDLFGHLDALLARAAVAFVGGTLARVGGHSPVGAAEAGVPLLAGPSVDGVRDLVEALRAAGGLRTVEGESPAEALAAEVATLLSDEDGRRRRGAAARGALAPFRGAATRTAERLLALARPG